MLFRNVTNPQRLIETVTHGSSDYQITYGTDYVAIDKRDRPNMSKSSVDSVTDAVSSVAEVGKLASDVRTQVLSDMADVTSALHQTQEFSKSLRDAGAKLRGVLGIQSNNPPVDG